MTVILYKNQEICTVTALCIILNSNVKDVLKHITALFDS